MAWDPTVPAMNAALVSAPIRNNFAALDVLMQSAVVNVKTYGAKGDGVTDDTAALAAAVLAGQGKTIYLPAGIYRTSAPLALTTFGTRIIGDGLSSVINITAAVNGVNITNYNCVVMNCCVRSSHATAGAAIHLTLGGAHFEEVLIDCATACKWSKGYHYDGDLVGHTTVLHGHVQGNTGDGIDTLFYLDTLSGGNTFIGALGTGHASAPLTTQGVYARRGVGFTWVGGVLEGGFAQAAVDIDGVAAAPAAALYNLYVECNAGAMIAVRYNNSSGSCLIAGATIQNAIHVGTAGTIGAYNFRLEGGVVGNVVLGTQAWNPVVAPDALGSFTDSGAIQPVVGPYRVIGNSYAEKARYPGLTVGPGGLGVGTAGLQFSGATPDAATDPKLAYSAPGILTQFNGTQRQILRIHADPASYLQMDAEVGYQMIMATAGSPTLLMVGTGTAAPLQFATTGAGRWQIDATGHLAPMTDLTFDLGSASLRPKSVYAARVIPSQVTVTYSASMTPDAALGDQFIITATNATAFTINAPTNPVAGQEITIRIRNTTAGALGTATWNAIFKMTAWTQPATVTSRAITFWYNGTNWVEVSRTTVDVPN